MNRRRFLSAAALAAGAAAWPAWLRRAFADVSVVQPGPSGLAAALERARRAGRPLLVLVIPSTDDEKYRRGRAFGEWINGGTDEDIAPLALCDVFCAPIADVRRAAPAAGAGEPLMVLFDERGAKRLDAKLPPDDWGADFRDQEKFVDRRIAAVARLAREGLASARPAARTNPNALRAQPVPGSHWAIDSVCGGITVEGMPDEQADMMDCGMGHLPSRCRRFLYFYSRTPSQRSRDAEKR